MSVVYVTLVNPRQPVHQRGDVVFLDTLVATSSTSFQPTAFPGRPVGVSFRGLLCSSELQSGLLNITVGR